MTVSLGTSVGKSVRPWLLQSTVLLLHTHLSGQLATNSNPNNPKITKHLSTHVSRLMMALHPTIRSGFVSLFLNAQDTSVTVSHLKPNVANILFLTAL